MQTYHNIVNYIPLTFSTHPPTAYQFDLCKSGFVLLF